MGKIIVDGIFLEETDEKGRKHITVLDGVKTVESMRYLEDAAVVSVTFPEGVEEIKNSLFANCVNLESVTLPKSIRRVESGAFNNTKWLKNYPDEYVIIGKGILYKYKGKDENIVIPEGITEISSHFLHLLRGLKSVIFPKGLKKIGAYAFVGCKQLESVSFPESLEVIEELAFADCEKLRSVEIRSKLDVKVSAFRDTEWLNKIPDEFVTFDDRTLYKYNGKERVVVVPDTIKKIQDLAFQNTKLMEKVVIPEGITKIPVATFRGCHELKEVILPESIKVIEGSAFSACTALEKINLPKGLTKLGKYAFCSCPIVEIEIPDGVTEIEEGTFFECHKLRKVRLSSNLRKIGQRAFEKCSDLERIEIPCGVKKIENSSFACCHKLKEAIVPETVTVIETSAFTRCSSLIYISPLTGVKKIDYYAFSKCRNLKKIILSEKLEKLNPGCFENCRSLGEIEMPQGFSGFSATSFDGTAWLNNNFGDFVIMGSYFYKYKGKESKIVIPQNVKEVSPNVFSDCKNVTSVTVHGGVSSIKLQTFEDININEIRFEEEFIKSGGIKRLSSEIKRIFWFREKESLKYIYLENGRITDWKCSGYKESVIRGFAKLAAEGYKFSEDVYESNKQYIKRKRNDLSRIAVKDFYLLKFMTEEKLIPFDDIDSLLEEIDNPELKAMMLGYLSTAFTAEEREKNLMKRFTANPFTLKEINKKWRYEFLNENEAAVTEYKGREKVIYVPRKIGKRVVRIIGGKSVSLFRTTRDKNENASLVEEIVIPDTVTEISNGAFWGCNNLKRLTIPDSVIKIGRSVLEDTEWLEQQTGSFVMANSFYLFKYTGTDAEVVIPDGVKIIGESAFYEADNMTSLVIPDSVTDIDYGAFSHCRNLKKVRLPKNLKEISDGVFSCCEALISITIPDGVTKIGQNAFIGCFNLEEIIIPESVTEIESCAFNETAWISKFKDDFIIINSKILYEYRGNDRDIVIPDGITAISEGALPYGGLFDSVTIPEGVTSIPERAFSLFTFKPTDLFWENAEFGFNETSDSLPKVVTLPASVTQINEYAFSAGNNFLIRAPRNSYSIKFAKENDINFEEI